MKQKLFVGSSSESAKLAKAVKTHLSKSVDVVVWDKNVFKLGQNTLETMLRAVREYDFAVLILGPDDKIRHRGAAGTTPRANVLFELGLFMGTLGSNRVFAMFSDHKKLFIPTEFDGVKVAKYLSKGLNRKDSASCRKATKQACEEIRAAIEEQKPVAAARSEILSKRTVLAIKSYLAFKQQDIKIYVEADDKTALEQFDSDCHAVLKDSHIYGSIQDALGKSFGVYVQATGAVGEGPEDERYLNCCLRPNAKRNGPTYLDAVLQSVRRQPPKTNFIEENIISVVRNKNFGHWLLGMDLDPVPLALVIDCSRKDEWNAKIIMAHETPMVFTIDASATSDDFSRALTELKNVAFAELDEHLRSLKRMLSDGKDNYMGSIIRSVLFIPIHGWPGITLQILTKERIKIDTETPRQAISPSETGDFPIRLTIDELMSIRLCGERLQGLLAHKVRPVPPASRQELQA
jgi:hypothetical protein